MIFFRAVNGVTFQEEVWILPQMPLEKFVKQLVQCASSENSDQPSQLKTEIAINGQNKSSGL